MRTTVLVVVMASSLAWADVMFSAPPKLREQVSATLRARGSNPIDASEIDDALFGNGRGYNAKRVVAKGNFSAQLPEQLPAAVRADFDLGLVACQQRLTKNPKATPDACAEELVDAVWERHLERIHPEKMIELRSPEKQGARFAIEAVVYDTGSTAVSGGSFVGDSVEALVPAVVRSLLDSKPAVMGLRPNSNLLPGEVPAPPPNLSDGTPQVLPKLEMPAGCTALETLDVQPASMPLAITLSALWKATVAGHVDTAAKPRRCTLALGDRTLQLHCGSSVAFVAIFGGTRFADAEFQASAARAFVQAELAVACSP